MDTGAITLGRESETQGSPAYKPVSVPDPCEPGGSHSSWPDITVRL